MSRDDQGHVLRSLADHTIALHFPEIADGRTDGFGPDDYVAWFVEVARRTAVMIVHWQRVGFVHGVMNTDNMSIHGLTIDYGPYGWLEDYDPGWTPNTTDREMRRYRFGAQPHIGQWNVTQLANAIYPLVERGRAAAGRRSTGYVDVVQYTIGRRMMAAKLGIADFDEARDPELIHGAARPAHRQLETDMTLFFRGISPPCRPIDAGLRRRAASLRSADSPTTTSSKVTGDAS